MIMMMILMDMIIMMMMTDGYEDSVDQKAFQVHCELKVDLS